MSNSNSAKQKFINLINEEVFKAMGPKLEKKYQDYWKQIIDFWNIFQSQNENSDLTENGMKVLKYMQLNLEKHNNLFTARSIGEGLFLSSRSIAGTMRKLINDGYAEKTGNNPVYYSLTEEGKTLQC